MDRLFAAQKPIVGMLHLPALPGAPHYAGDWPQLIDRALSDALTLVDGRVHGLIVENFGDRPFFPRRVPRATVACLTHVAGRVRERFPSVPLGINVLRNDGESGISIALAVGADFIRVNVLCGARVTDQGVLEGIAHRLLRLRARLGATAIRIFADVNVKHSTPVGPGLPIEQEVADVIQRGGADAVVVSGTGTGAGTNLALLQRVKAAARGTPVFVGSGVTAENVREYLPHCDGLIVGTSLKVDGKASNPVDPARVGALIATLG
jgi:membrane complex biogenesis BtpA family protein